MSEFHDFVQLPAQGQVTAGTYVTPGALTTNSSPQYLAVPMTSAMATAAGPFIAANVSFAVQDNNAAIPVGYLSDYPWQTTVTGPVYYSPGGILNKVGPSNFNLTTGGGP